MMEKSDFSIENTVNALEEYLSQDPEHVYMNPNMFLFAEVQDYYLQPLMATYRIDKQRLHAHYSSDDEVKQRKKYLRKLRKFLPMAKRFCCMCKENCMRDKFFLKQKLINNDSMRKDIVFLGIGDEIDLFGDQEDSSQKLPDVIHEREIADLEEKRLFWWRLERTAHLLHRVVELLLATTSSVLPE